MKHIGLALLTITLATLEGVLRAAREACEDQLGLPHEEGMRWPDFVASELRGVAPPPPPPHHHAVNAPGGTA